MTKLLVLLFIFTLSYSNELEKVSIQFQWLEQFQFAGYYIAKEKGFYEDVGLDVEFKSFSKELCPTDAVLNKKATYGIGRSALISDISKGKNLLLLSAIFQSSPYVILATKKSNIKNIKDFKNKKIMTINGIADRASIKAMLVSNQIDFSSLICKKRSKSDTYDTFIRTPMTVSLGQ